MSSNRYMADYARLGTSGCKKCKVKIDKGAFRLAKLVANPFAEDSGDMKQFFHPKCLFETFQKARATTKVIEDADDVEGFSSLGNDDKKILKELMDELATRRGQKEKNSKPKQPPTPRASPGKKATSAVVDFDDQGPDGDNKDNSFRQFRRLCADIASESSYLAKSGIVANFLRIGNSSDEFSGNVYLLMKFLLPGVMKTVYNLDNKQIIKIFSLIFATSLTEMMEDLEKGDVAETIRIYFECSTKLQAVSKSTLTLYQVDKMLTELSKHTKEDDQAAVLTEIALRSTPNDLKMIVRLIKHDLRINAGAKHILEGLHSSAYEAFQASRDLLDVVTRVEDIWKDPSGLKKQLSIRASLMTPILPMLASPCKSVEEALKKCPSGMYAEIKYDGERVQLHKRGDEYKYFSRSLKPVLPHKVKHFENFIPKAFEHGRDLILDCEVLLIDRNTNKPLPFGSLGKHKQQEHASADVALFVFDCLHYNGENLMDRAIKERRAIMLKNMKEVKHHILFSEMKHITKSADLKDVLAFVLNEGLEGLVLKDVDSTYEPGKRHWLKVKKDYLLDGTMADSADLIVLGAYYGTGNKGGLMSIFLMGVYDPTSKKYCTVTKCGSGFDDKTLEELNKDLDMIKVSQDSNRVPSWLLVNRSLMPDFFVADPKKAPVWEIMGAEFSKAAAHTACGISIRFPRCSRMRSDKTWLEATNLDELKVLAKDSKERSDFDVLVGGDAAKGAFYTMKDGQKLALGSNGDGTELGGNGPESGSSLIMSSDECKQEQIDDNERKRSSSSGGGTSLKRVKKSSSEKSGKSHASNSPSASMENPLCDIFQGMRFHMPSTLERYAELRRYIIAYGGKVVEDLEETVTHFIVENENSMNAHRNEISLKWLIKCIKRKTLLKVKHRAL